jgi:hypothetical protein
MEGNTMQENTAWSSTKNTKVLLTELSGLYCPFCGEWPLELKLNKATDIHLDGPGFSVGCAGIGKTDCPNITHAYPRPDDAIDSALDAIDYFRQIEENRPDFS